MRSPGMKHLRQGDFAKPGVPDGSSKIAILYLPEQSQAFQTRPRERLHKLLGSL